MEGAERRAHISAQNQRLPSYGILQSENGNSASIRVLNSEIGMESLPNGNNANDGFTGGASTSNIATPTATNITSDYDTVLSKRKGLSTVSGVFAPVTISMFSALLYLRMGFAAGQLGFLMTGVELLLAYSIILLTVLSLCAVSSNGAVEGGGVYYMISRTLGPEFGGSIGVLFFVANVFSCALYISGFTEAFGNMTGVVNGYGGKFFHCVLVSLVILALCLLGAEIFAKTALMALAVVALAYGSFVFTIFVKPPAPIPVPHDNTFAYMVRMNATDPGSATVPDFNQTLSADYTSFSISTFTGNLFSNYTMDYTTGRATDFAFMFAIIFSGVTGLMAGANMSGELARPNVSIPRGTLQAVFTTLLTYLLTAFLLCLTCSRHLLQFDYLVMVDMNVVPSLVMLGIFAATFFSSMSNMIGASRVLNRLAQDKLFGMLLQPATVEYGKSGNPVVSVIISWSCVVLVFMMGTMNRIAKITSIFFLLSYMGVNIACLALELTSAPNFRPNFKYFSWHTCAAGALSTVTMMLVIDASMSAVAIVILMLLIMILHYQAPIGSWGSISQALIYHQVRKYLLLLDVRKEHVKFWRPQILLLVNKPATCCQLMDFVNDIKKSGLYVIGHVRHGSMMAVGGAADGCCHDPLQQIYPYWLSLVDYLKIKAFVELTLTDSVRSGIQQLIRLSGLGAMKPNTVVLGFHEPTASETVLSETHLLKDLRYSKIGRGEVVEYFTSGDFVPKELNAQVNDRLTAREYVHIVNDVLNLNKNLCVARHFARFDRELMLKQNGKRYIDVWPSHLFRPDDHSGLRWDNSSLFVLQLACILSMSSKWRNATLRVFICVNSLQDMHFQEAQLKALLEQLRIKAKSVMVPWDHVISQMERSTNNSGGGSTQNIAEFPTTFVRAVNEMIRRNSAETVVCFLNMPTLPQQPLASFGGNTVGGGGGDRNSATDEEEEERKCERYLAALRQLTDALPPTMLVHGLSSVISTAL